MKWLLIVLAILVLILFLPLYLCIRYDGEFRILVRVLFFRFEINLGDITSNKKKKKRLKKSGKTTHKTDSVKTSGYSFAEQITKLFTYVKMIHVLIVRSFTVEKICVTVKVGTNDPCDTAILFGTVNSIMCAFLAYVESIITLRKKNISVTADYNAEQTEVYFLSVNRTNLLKLAVSLIKSAADGTIKLEKGE